MGLCAGDAVCPGRVQNASYQGRQPAKLDLVSSVDLMSERGLIRLVESELAERAHHSDKLVQCQYEIFRKRVEIFRISEVARPDRE